MKTLLCLAALALVPLTTLALAQEKKAAPAAMNDDPMMANMIAYGTPGPAHEILSPKVGKWDLTIKMLQPDGQSDGMSQAKSEVEWIFDGRFLEETTEGSFAGMPFHGRGLTGYDNYKETYVSTWIDNFSTGVMTSQGSWNAATKTFTHTGEMPDFMTGTYVASRTTDTMIDADHWTMKMYQPGPDGKEYMSMQIDYARAK
jgi:hypothetical protein